MCNYFDFINISEGIIKMFTGGINSNDNTAKNYKSNNSVENQEIPDTLLTSLFGVQNSVNIDHESTSARELVIKYFALGKFEAENLKKLMESSNSYAAMVSSNSISGGVSGVLANFVNPQAIASTMGAGIGSMVGPVGTLAGGALGHTLGAAPGFQSATHGLLGAVSGSLIASSVYLLQATRSKWINIKKFKKFMEYNLFSWENEQFRGQSIKIQASAEILTKYLRAKTSGRFTETKLLRISWEETDSGFYLINSFTKILFILLQTLDKMPNLLIRSILLCVEEDLKTEPVASKIPKDFKAVFQEFKEKIEQYLKCRLYEETIVENLGNTIVSGSSAMTPIIPWIYCCLLGDDSHVNFYDPEKFNKQIEEESIKATAYKYWCDLSLIKVNEIRKTKELQLEAAEKKIGKVNSLIKDLNNQKWNLNAVEEMPNAKESKTEKKVNKLFEYAHEFLKYNFNVKDKNLERIITLTYHLVKLEAPTFKTSIFNNAALNKMYEWWNSGSKPQNKISNNISIANQIGIIKTKHIDPKQKILTKEEFKNVVLIVFEIRNEFNKNNLIKEKFSQQYKKGEDKIPALQYAHKIDSFCELLTYADRVSEFLTKDNEKDKLSIYSLFGLWSVYNVILEKYSTNIPPEILNLYHNKKLANNENSNEYLNKYFIIPYESFSKFLIQGFNQEYFEKNSNDFFRMYIFYLSNIINLVSEIQYHTEILKFTKLMIAMYGEEETTFLISTVPLELIKSRIFSLKKVMEDLYNHINKLQSDFETDKNSSWYNTFGLYNFFFGKETGFYKNFEKRYKEYIVRLDTFQKNIAFNISMIEQKKNSNSSNSRSINESIARKTDQYFKYSLNIYLKYLQSVHLKNPNHISKESLNKLEYHVLDLQERHEHFIADSALMAGYIPQIKAPIHLTPHLNHPIHGFLIGFFHSGKYKFPSKVYSISKQKNSYTSMSCLLQNFLKDGEANDILEDCIDKIRENQTIEKISYHYYARNSVFDVTRSEAFLGDAEIRQTLFLNLFANMEKDTKIKLTTNIEHKSFSKEENLLKESGLNKINIDFENNFDNTENAGILVYLITYVCCFSPANNENVLKKYYGLNGEGISEANKIRSLHAVWGLYGLVLAYMFSGTREQAQKTLQNYFEEKEFRKIEQAKMESVKDKNLLAERKKFTQEKIVFDQQLSRLSDEKKLLEKSHNSIYSQIVHSVKLEMLRLDNTDKGKVLMQKLQESDRKNSINLIKDLKAILSQHRGMFAFGNAQSYKNILEVAKKNGLQESEFS